MVLSMSARHQIKRIRRMERVARGELITLADHKLETFSVPNCTEKSHHADQKPSSDSGFSGAHETRLQEGIEPNAQDVHGERGALTVWITNKVRRKARTRR
jgi:hypothetical protein